MFVPQPNQLYRKLLGIAGLNPFDGADSSSRKQMMASSHLSQCLVIEGSEERRIQTGLEREFGKYTFSVKMPEDGTVISIIDRYRQTIGQNSIKRNPQTIVLYEKNGSKEIDFIELTQYHALHPYFGFPYKKTKNMDELRRNASFKKGTIFLDSPSVNETGGYQYGLELNVALMSIPGVAEDGNAICRDVLPRFKFKTYETRTFSFGSKQFPLNIYGDGEQYLAFPDIGDFIRDDNVLVALRDYNTIYPLSDMSVTATRKIDFSQDKVIYGGGPGGKVIDIKIIHDPINSSGQCPEQMELQARKYHTATVSFYKELLDEYNRLRRERGELLRISPKLHRLLVEAMAIVNPKEQKIIKEYKRNPLDDWYVEIVIEYTKIPDKGFKITDLHGGKGVITKILEPDQMPVDANGVRADLIMDPGARNNRMNIGGLFEQYFNAVRDEFTKNLIKKLGVPNNKPNAVYQLPDNVIDEMYEILVNYYGIHSIRMFHHFRQPGINKRDELYHVVKDGIYLYMPPENENEYMDIVDQLEQMYKPTYGPVTYVDDSGQRQVTDEPVRIGSMYIVLLEKIANDWIAVSSGVPQHFGILAPTPQHLKDLYPAKMHAIRGYGEAETRLYLANAGSDITSDLLDRNNNPQAHEQIVDNLLTAKQPSNIRRAIDRTKAKLGASKPLMLLKHLLSMFGVRFKYTKK